MKIAYLLNTYPMTSTTFVRREIEALERLGLDIERYAVRRWKEKLVDPRDLQEVQRTKYLLSGNVIGLLIAFLQHVFLDPRALWRGVVAMRKLADDSGGLNVRQFAYLLQAVYLVKQARLDGIQHIHAHFSTNATTVAMLARVMGGPSYSFTAHGPDEFDDARALALDAKLSNASFAVAISNFCKMKLMYIGGFRHADKIHVIHCGVDTKEFDASAIEGDVGQTFVCVGRLCRAKGQALIPAAVSLLKTDFPDVRVILIGDGESRREVEDSIAAHGVRQNVEIRGWAPNSTVRDLIRSSRSLLLPSFAEGLPIVIMESLAMGRPVISTYIAGIPELLDSECGWIIPAGSVEKIAEAMRGALDANSTTLSRLGAVGRARVIAGFDVDDNARILAGHFDEAI